MVEAKYAAAARSEDAEDDGEIQMVAVERPARGSGSGKSLVIVLLAAMLAALAVHDYAQRQNIAKLKGHIETMAGVLEKNELLTEENGIDLEDLFQEVLAKEDKLEEEEAELNMQKDELDTEEELLEEREAEVQKDSEKIRQVKEQWEAESDILVKEEELLEDEKEDLKKEEAELDEEREDVAKSEERVENELDDLEEDLETHKDDDSKKDRAAYWAKFMKRQNINIKPKKRDYSINTLGRTIPKRPCPPKPRAARFNFLFEQPADKQCLNMNIIFMKGPDVHGDIMGGVSRRIAQRQGLNCVGCSLEGGLSAQEPKILASHGTTIDYIRTSGEGKLGNFKWAMLRNPVDRCISNFFHRQPRNGRPIPSSSVEDQLVGYLKSSCHNRLNSYYGLHNDIHRETVDFFGVAERPDESLLALAHLLELPLADILYVGTTSRGRGAHKVGNRVVDTAKMQKLQAFVNSTEWLTKNQFDYKHLSQAETSLANIIQRVGRTRFEQQLEEYNRHKENAGKKCINTRKRPCYWGNDNGCYYLCLDDYAQHHHLYTPVSSPGWKTVDTDSSWSPKPTYLNHK